MEERMESAVTSCSTRFNAISVNHPRACCTVSEGNGISAHSKRRSSALFRASATMSLRLSLAVSIPSRTMVCMPCTWCAPEMINP